MSDDKFRDRYRISSSRLREWNYASIGWYFVTFCVNDRESVLSKISNDSSVRLTPIGHIVFEEIFETQFLRPNIGIDAFVIMPDHVHVIIEIMANVETARWAVSDKNQTLISGSIGAIIGQIKSAATKRFAVLFQISRGKRGFMIGSYVMRTV